MARLGQARGVGGEKRALLIIAVISICTFAIATMAYATRGLFGDSCVSNNNDMELFIVCSLMDTYPTVSSPRR